VESPSPPFFPLEQASLLTGPFVRRSYRLHDGPSYNLAMLAHRNLTDPALHYKLAFQV
jgi:hypothetical protein